jgi:histone acetyltransferase (RNA polymerase elongator complex component)
MYRDTKFELRSFEEIAADVEQLEDFFPGCETVFIGDSNSLLHKDLVEIVKLVKKTLPDVKRITSYARAHTLHVKKVQQLEAMREAGLSRLHVGLESGDGEILERISKGAAPEIMVDGGCKARQAGFELCFYVLCGIGGNKQWQKHAEGTAKVINAVNPDFVRLRTLSLVPDAPLFGSWKAGEFEPITPLNRLKETRRLIEQFTVSDCELASDHVTNYLWAPGGIIYHGVDGVLPGDKEWMLGILDAAIEKVKTGDDVLDANMMVQRGYIQRL